MEYQWTDGRYSWDMDLLQWSINEFVYDFRSPATLLGQTQDSVTQRWAWKVHYNSWYDFYSYQDRQELPEKKCGFAAIPTARTKVSTVASRREVFFAFSFRLKSGVKREPDFLLIVFDRYLYFVPFRRKKTFRVWSAQRGDLSNLERSVRWMKSAYPNRFPRHGHGPHGWSHRYWPIPRNEEERSFCTGVVKCPILGILDITL